MLMIYGIKLSDVTYHDDSTEDAHELNEPSFANNSSIKIGEVKVHEEDVASSGRHAIAV